MSVRSRIEASGGSLIRQPDSQWVISVWYIPGGYDYTNAEAVVGFFPNELYDVVSALEEEWDCMPEMASVMDLRDPKVDAAFQRKESTCRHCGAQVWKAGQQWHSDQEDWPQYCWVDPEKGSQLHEG